MRMIDADDLIERFDLLEKSPAALRGIGLKPIMAIEDIKTVIQATPTVGATNWISVKDRLPETNDEVLTTYLYDDKPRKLYVETANYFDDGEGEGEGHWHSVWDEFIIGRVRKTTIAWMPMPKPYKPSKEDNDEAD